MSDLNKNIFFLFFMLCSGFSVSSAAETVIVDRQNIFGNAIEFIQRGDMSSAPSEIEFDLDNIDLLSVTAEMLAPYQAESGAWVWNGNISNQENWKVNILIDGEQVISLRIDLGVGLLTAYPADGDGKQYSLSFDVNDVLDSPIFAEADTIELPESRVFGLRDSNRFFRPLAKPAQSDAIDILFVFSDDAERVEQRDFWNIGRTIEEMLGIANSVFEDSGINTRFRAVQSLPVELTESGNTQADLNSVLSLKTETGEVVQEVRERIGADIVVLLVAEAFDMDGRAGIAYADGVVDRYLAKAVVSLKNRKFRAHVLAHELGHVLGLYHDRFEYAGDIDTDKYPDGNYGYFDEETGVRTIMASDAACRQRVGGCTDQIFQFSDPEHLHDENDGRPIGDNYANAVDHIRSYWHAIAGIYDRPKVEEDYGFELQLNRDTGDTSFKLDEFDTGTWKATVELDQGTHAVSFVNTDTMEQWGAYSLNRDLPVSGLSVIGRPEIIIDIPTAGKYNIEFKETTGSFRIASPAVDKKDYYVIGELAQYAGSQDTVRAQQELPGGWLMWEFEMAENASYYDLSTLPFKILDASTNTVYGTEGYEKSALEYDRIDARENGWNWMQFHDVIPDGKLMVHTSVLNTDINSNLTRSATSKNCDFGLPAYHKCNIDKANKILIAYHPTKHQVYFQLQRLNDAEYEEMKSLVMQFGGMPTQFYDMYSVNPDQYIEEGAICDPSATSGSPVATDGLSIKIPSLNVCMPALPFLPMKGLWRGDIISGDDDFFLNSDFGLPAITGEDQYLVYHNFDWRQGSIGVTPLSEDLPPFPVISSAHKVLIDNDPPYIEGDQFRVTYDGRSSFDLDGEIVEWHWYFHEEERHNFIERTGPIVEVMHPTRFVKLAVKSDTGQEAQIEREIVDLFPSNDLYPELINYTGFPEENLQPYHFNYKLSLGEYRYGSTYNDKAILRWQWVCLDNPDLHKTDEREIAVGSIYSRQWITCPEVELLLTLETGEVVRETRNLDEVVHQNLFERIFNKYPFDIEISKQTLQLGEEVSLEVVPVEGFVNGWPYLNYYWGMGDKTTIKTSTPVLKKSYSEPGTYIEMVTVETANQEVYSGAIAITVEGPPNQLPIPLFTVPEGPIYAGSEVTFDASASYDTDGDISQYQWSVDNGQSNQLTTTFGSPGTYDIELTVLDNDGDQAALSQRVTVLESVAENVAPVPIITVSTQQVAVNEPVSFDASASYDTDGDIVRYLWSVNDATEEETSYTFQATGEAQVTLTVWDDDGVSESITLTIEVGTAECPEGGKRIEGGEDDSCKRKSNKSDSSWWPFGGSISIYMILLLVPYGVLTRCRKFEKTTNMETQ